MVRENSSSSMSCGEIVVPRAYDLTVISGSLITLTVSPKFAISPK